MFNSYEKSIIKQALNVLIMETQRVIGRAIQENETKTIENNRKFIWEIQELKLKVEGK